MTAIEQAGQHIVRSQIRQLHDQPPLLGDVTHESDGAGLVMPHGHAQRHVHRHQAAVGTAQHQIRHAPHRARVGRVEKGVHALGVCGARWQRQQQVQRLSAQFVLTVAGQPLQCRVDRQQAPLPIDHQDAVRGIVEHPTRQRVQRLPQRFTHRAGPLRGRRRQGRAPWQR
nr:hypothetical protein [Tepidimonas charontis]